MITTQGDETFGRCNWTIHVSMRGYHSAAVTHAVIGQSNVLLMDLPAVHHAVIGRSNVLLIDLSGRPSRCDWMIHVLIMDLPSL